MPVSTLIAKSGPYNTGGTGPFSYAFRILDEDHIRVVLTSAAGVETDLTLTTDYTVAGVGEAAGGTVTLVEEPDFAGGELLTLVRNVPKTQETDLENQGGWYPEVIEDALDKLTMQTQDLAEAVERSVKVQVSNDTDPDTLVSDLVVAAASAEAAATAAEAAQGLAEDARDTAVAAAATVDLPGGVASTFITGNAGGTAWEAAITFKDEDDMASDSATAVPSQQSVKAYAEPKDADILKADVADVLTKGFAATPYNAGTKTTGTFTPDEANGNLQYCVNGGAFTLAPPTNSCSIVVQITNNASAGAITTSGFTKVSGTAPGTTDGYDFLAYILKLGAFSHLTWVALQ